MATLVRIVCVCRVLLNKEVYNVNIQPKGDFFA